MVINAYMEQANEPTVPESPDVSGAASDTQGLGAKVSPTDLVSSLDPEVRYNAVAMVCAIRPTPSASAVLDSLEEIARYKHVQLQIVAIALGLVVVVIQGLTLKVSVLALTVALASVVLRRCRALTIAMAKAHVLQGNACARNSILVMIAAVLRRGHLGMA